MYVSFSAPARREMQVARRKPRTSAHLWASRPGSDEILKRVACGRRYIRGAKVAERHAAAAQNAPGRAFTVLTTPVDLSAFDDAGFHDAMLRARDRGLYSASQVVADVINCVTGAVGIASAASTPSCTTSRRPSTTLGKGLDSHVA
jgi:hypothetical protein